MYAEDIKLVFCQEEMEKDIYNAHTTYRKDKDKAVHSPRTQSIESTTDRTNRDLGKYDAE